MTDDDDNKVVPLRAGLREVVRQEPEEEIPQADPYIVRYLEMLLDDARAGDIKALAVVALKEPDVMKYWFNSQSPFSNALIGATQRLVSRMSETLNQDK